MSQNTSANILTYIVNLLKEFCIVVSLQTILFTLFWNMTVVGIFNTQDYTISILTALYAILAFKVFTFSYIQLLIRSNTAIIQSHISSEINYRKAKDEMLAAYMMDAMEKSTEKGNSEINS